MPEITDPRLLAQIQAQQVAGPAPQQLPTQPQPFPGAMPAVRFPQREFQNNATTQRLGIDYQQNERANNAAGLSQQTGQREQTTFNNKQDDRQANSGVDTGHSQDRASQHVIALTLEMGILDDVRSKDPAAFRPTWKEKGVTTLTSDPDYTSWAKSPQRQRVTAAYRNVIESALYMKTGAAYNETQFLGQVEALVPQMFDSLEVLADKKLRLQGVIEGARAEAGPANVKAQAALDRLANYSDVMYEPPGVVDDRGTKQSVGKDRMELTDDFQVIPVPKKMQDEHTAFLTGKSRGDLDVGEYLAFRQKLGAKYDFNQESSAEAVGKFVKDFNNPKTRISLRLPASKEKLKGFGSFVADQADSSVGTAAANYANAMTFGVPEALAGRSGRQAFDMLNAENPGSALTGEILGSLVPTVALERLGLKGFEKLGKLGIKSKIAADVGANAGYAGIRGFNASEEEDGWGQTLKEAGAGAVGSLVARGITRGSGGFRDPEEVAKVDALRNSQTFEMPADRPALAADDVTPPHFQSMDDTTLKAEAAKARQGLETWKIYDKFKEAKAEEYHEVVNKITAFAKNNKIEIADAAEHPVFKAELRAASPPPPPEIPSPLVLRQRAERIDGHLMLDATPKTGTIPGTDLTTMQRAGLTGGEEFIQGAPFVHTMREAANASWARQNSARVLARVGKELPKGIPAGQKANAHVTEQLSDAYNTLRPSIKGKIDPRFDRAVQALEFLSKKEAVKRPMWQQVNTVVQKFRNADGSFDGNGYQKLSEGLRSLANDWNLGQAGDGISTVEARDMARVAEKVRKQAQALIGRTNPAVRQRLKNLEGAWAHQARINAASVGAAKSSRGVPSPDEYLNAIQRLDTSKDKTAIARNQGLDQPYAQDARDVLGSKPAKKGSVMQAGMIGFAATQHPIGQVLAAATVAGYTPGIKRGMQFIIDGKLGSTIDQVTKNLPADSPLKTLPADTMRALIAQGIRAYIEQKGR